MRHAVLLALCYYLSILMVASGRRDASVSELPSPNYRPSLSVVMMIPDWALKLMQDGLRNHSVQLFPAMSDRCPNGPPSNATVAANATNCLVGLLESAWKEAKAHRSAGSGFHHVAAFVSVLDDGHTGATDAWLRFAARHKMAAVSLPASLRLIGSKLEMADLAASAGQWASFFPTTYPTPDDARFPAIVKLYPVTGSGGRGVFFVQNRAAMDKLLNGKAAKLAKEQGEPQPLLQEAINSVTGSTEHVLHVVAHKGELLRIYLVHVFNISWAIPPPPDHYIDASELPQWERVLAFVAWLCHATQLDGMAFIQTRVRRAGGTWNLSEEKC